MLFACLPWQRNEFYSTSIRQMKVVGGKHNNSSTYMFVHLTQLVLSSATLLDEIFCSLFLINKLVIHFLPATEVKWILFLNHRNRKVLGDKHNVVVLHYVHVCASDPACVALWNPFKWDILWFIIFDQKSCCQRSYFCAVGGKIAKRILFLTHMKQESCRRLTQCSSTLCECLYTWPSWCRFLHHFQMRNFAVHF